MDSTPAGIRSVPVTTRTDGTQDRRRDLVAVEAPLEVRVNGERFAVMMRTPGDDRHLALGFLFSEHIVTTRADVLAVDTWPGDAVLGNRLNVLLGGSAADVLEKEQAERRRVAMTSACGLCGRVSLDSLARDAAPIPITWTIEAARIASFPARLRASQPVFEGTGGLHAAALLTREGSVVTSAEDVGRHNAVDKTIGAMLDDDRLPLCDLILAVSGRASFELVQKACLSGVPMLVAVSAPSSLAIDSAEVCGITLVGFARGDRFNIYTHPRRIVDRSPLPLTIDR
jgi:FdhD protein